MRKRQRSTTMINVISSFLLQICQIVSAFIVPKIIISYFGSEVNGLIGTLTQLLSYISLIEGGITSVIAASLYRPLHNNDTKRVSEILKTSTGFFRKIGFFYILYALLLAIVYPFCSKTNFDFWYISSITLILSTSLLIQYTMSLSAKTLLTADKKVYVVSFVQIIIVVTSTISAILSVKIYPDIHILKLITGFLYILQPIFFNAYIKKHYKINKNAKKNNELLKQRWDGFAVNIAAFIHNSTDIVILSIFTNLETVSVYTTYALVTTGIRSIIQSIARGITPTLGHSLASNDTKKINSIFDSFELVIFTLTSILFSTAALLIVPFVKIYTNNVADANYDQPLFAILLIISEICYLLREHHVALSYSANKFKEITKPCITEAIINIVVSLVLVPNFGLIGVAIGTIIAMLYRTIYHVFYTKKLIGRPLSKFFSNAITFSCGSIIGIIISNFVIKTQASSFIDLIYHGIIYIVIISASVLLVLLIFKNKKIRNIKNNLIRKK